MTPPPVGGGDGVVTALANTEVNGSSALVLGQQVNSCSSAPALYWCNWKLSSLRRGQLGAPALLPSLLEVASGNLSMAL